MPEKTTIAPIWNQWVVLGVVMPEKTTIALLCNQWVVLWVVIPEKTTIAPICNQWVVLWVGMLGEPSLLLYGISWKGSLDWRFFRFFRLDQMSPGFELEICCVIGRNSTHWALSSTGWQKIEKCCLYYLSIIVHSVWFLLEPLWCDINHFQFHVDWFHKLNTFKPKKQVASICNCYGSL